MKARSIMVYGDSGETKTSQGYYMAKWVWKTFNQRTRWISFDGKYDQLMLPQKELDNKSLVEARIVQLWDAANMKTALADVRRFSEGYWPRHNNKTGLPYFRSDKNCETADWDKIGLYVLDDITSLCDSWLVHASDQAEQIGPQKSHPWIYEEEGYTFRGVSDTHYGVVQKELVRVVKQGFNQLPIRYVMYMAKVEKGTENYRRKRQKRNDPTAEPEPNITTMYGPKTAGNAQTSFVPGWFADCFHLGRVQTEKYGEVRVAWYDRHEHEQTTVPFMARVDILPEDIPKLREKWKAGCIPLGTDSGLNKFYQWLLEIEK